MTEEGFKKNKFKELAGLCMSLSEMLEFFLFTCGGHTSSSHNY